MSKKSLLAGLSLLALSICSAQAQNTQCSNRPNGDSTNACANTRFVQSAISGLGMVGSGTIGQLAVYPANGTTVSGSNIVGAPAYFGFGRPWVDVRSTANGNCPAAVGDGATDDQPAIQCQANYLSTNFAGGDLKADLGNFHLGSTLSLPTGVSLVCAGLGSTALSVSTDLTALTFGAAATSVWIRNCEIAGSTSGAATQNLVVVPAGANVSFYDSWLVGGNFALEQHGTDGVIFNTIIQGYGTSGGGVTSTGANWYIHAKIDQGSATAVAFKQGLAVGNQENHIILTDMSGNYTNSVVIDDGGSHTAITTFEGSVFSSPIAITSANATMFSANEFGSSTLTFDSGSLTITGSKILSGSITVGGAGTNINCAGNIGINCKGANGTPGGSTTQLQYNNAGVFGGVAGVTSNGTTLTFADGDLILSGLTSGSSTLKAPATGGGTATLFAGTDTIAGLTLAHGGTNNSLTASNGGIVWSDASKLNVATGFTGLVLGSNSGAPTAYAGTSCTNQFLRSLNASGVGTCATVANTDLANSSVTYGTTTVALGASSTSIAGLTGLSETSTATYDWNSDLFLGRNAAASLRLGQADAASPVAQILGVQSVVAGTNNTAGANFTIAGSNSTGSGTGGAILLQTATAGGSGTSQNALSTRLAVLGNGNIGFGTETNPQFPFVFSANATTGATFTGGTFSGVMLFGSTGQASVGYNVVTIANSGTNSFSRLNNTLASPSNLGSGDTIGAFTFSGWGNGAFQPGRARMLVTTTEAWSGTTFGTSIEFDSTAAGGSRGQSLLLKGGVTVGTSTTDPGVNNLLVGGTIAVSGMTNVATTSAVCYNTGTGLLTYDATVGTCTVSDERLKNIGPRIDGALAKLLLINGFRFTFKDAQYGQGEQIGVGAQTVERVFPELVSTDSHGTKSVSYDRLTAPIIEALRELKADNDNIRTELGTLKRNVK